MRNRCIVDAWTAPLGQRLALVYCIISCTKANRYHDSPKKPRSCLYLGAVITVAVFVLNLFYPIIVGTILSILLPSRPPVL